MAAAAAAWRLDSRVVAALPAGVRLADLRGPWMLDAGDVRFESDARGRPRVLGRGASGTVFAGTHCGDPAAIKQVSPTTADGVNAWLTEVQLQYRIRVEGVLAVHGALLDIDDTGAPLYYIVMQRVPGSMASLVLTPSGALVEADIRRRIHWLRQAAAALASLHARNIIHGDVKPANIMLSSADEAEAAVRVADFGSALVRSPEAGTLTTHRGERGSMVYMDPVLFHGGSVKAASDTYSWAITAWQVLSGRVPYAAELSATGLTSEASALEKLRKHVRGAAGQRPPPEALEDRGVPDAVIDEIVRCWAAAPSDRPAMAEVAATLADALASGVFGGYPTLLVPSSVASPPRRRVAAELTAAISARNKARVVARLITMEELESDTQRVACMHDGAGMAAKDALAAFTGDVEVVRAACGAWHLQTTSACRWCVTGCTRR